MKNIRSIAHQRSSAARSVRQFAEQDSHTEYVFLRGPVAVVKPKSVFCAAAMKRLMLGQFFPE
jgi:hypothetical protein